MSLVPLGRGSSDAGGHLSDAVRYALEDDERTRRLCRIVLAMSIDRIARVVVSLTALVIVLLTGHVI